MRQHCIVKKYGSSNQRRLDQERAQGNTSSASSTSFRPLIYFLAGGETLKLALFSETGILGGNLSRITTFSLVNALVLLADLS